MDYGFPSHELYKPYRQQGKFVCHYRQVANALPYEKIGLQDIIAHINFPALHHRGQKFGLGTTGFTNQKLFLIALESLI